jgi:type II secretory ATPase GspE/PulE/Tfp pilus assembly ATPase PilB-like protein
VPNPRNSKFIDLVLDLPNFDYPREMRQLLSEHPDGVDLLTSIIDQKLLPKDEACRLWADAMGLAYVDPFVSVITEEAVARIPAEIARKVKCVGLYVFAGTLTVAMASPDEADVVRRVGNIAQIPISPVFALPREIEDAIAIHYSNEQTLEQSLAGLERASIFDQGDLSNDKLAMVADSESIVAFVDEIIYYALRERATDIHIEPQETLARVRFRVDGNLREMLTYSRKLHRAFISRLKIISNLNIAEARFPQDGRFSMSIGAQTANFRFSCIPSQYGEKAVIRILAFSGKRTMLTLDKMAVSQNVMRPFKRLIKNPNGIIFVTGPTGSGKTTTLYAALHEINAPSLNISTIEDPVEIQLQGVTQTQVNHHIDLKFSTILRALLRQDPDVILIGEIRDLETAKIATEAALTGHLVFATLHTNTAAQAIVRLMEIGVEPYMVAPSVLGVLAQRLAARICENCKEPYQPSRDILCKYFQEEGLTDVPFYRGKGCSVCRGTGYKGRVAIHELIVITEEIRTMISEKRSSQDITRAAAKVGYRSLRYDGLKKVLMGLTTIDEIEQNTSFEWAT